MTKDGPDMAEVEKAAAADPAVKGILFVPTYSNPTGDTVSDDTVKRLASMKTAAPDFTIFADDAYVVHHLVDNPRKPKNLLRACEEAGNPNRVYLFSSTSKITFSGAGLGFHGDKHSQPGVYFQTLRDHVHRTQQGGTVAPCKIPQRLSGRGCRPHEGTRQTAETQIRHHSKSAVERTWRNRTGHLEQPGRAVISSVWTRQNRLPSEPWRSAKRQALPSHRPARRFLSARTPKMPISGFHRPGRPLPNWKKPLKCWRFALNWPRRNREYDSVKK